MTQKISQKRNLKERLRRAEVTIGSWITIGNEIIAEIMARQGFDWLVIDMEHSAIDLSQTQNLARIIAAAGCTPLVRVPENDPVIIKRVMDTGAHGVIVPMVNTKAEAQRAVGAVYYPPRGSRGVGLARAQGYGTRFEAYKEWLTREAVVIVQVEHIDAVKNLKEILTVPNIDGFMVGPYDLSGSMGFPGEFDRPELKGCIRDILTLAKDSRITAGFHVIPPDVKEVALRISQGYRFIAVSLDTLILQRAAEGLVSSCRRSS